MSHQRCGLAARASEISIIGHSPFSQDSALESRLAVDVVDEDLPTGRKSVIMKLNMKSISFFTDTAGA
jgi:hypothetical protein